VEDYSQIDINYISKDDLTALQCAIQQGHKAIVEYLVEKGASMRDELGSTSSARSLSLACRKKDIVEYFCNDSSMIAERTKLEHGIRNTDPPEGMYQTLPNYPTKPVSFYFINKQIIRKKNLPPVVTRKAKRKK
jgi:ankyrin repeat protein